MALSRDKDYDRRMIRRLSLILCLGLSLAAVSGAGACKSAPAPTAQSIVPPTPAQVDSAVKSRIEQYRQGYEVRSLEALAPLYSHTDDLTVTVQGRTQRGWTAAEAQLSAFLQKAVTVKVRISEQQVIALGDAGALATMNVHRSFGDGVTTVDEMGTLVLVFRRVTDEWFIVAEHYSYAPAGQP
jgi:ketosteroid isomerase-like protein